MKRIKKGDVVGRISYGKDILFTVERIIQTVEEKQIAILKGITVRIEADAPIDDLELIEKQEIEENLRGLDIKLNEKIEKYNVKLKSHFDIFNKTKKERSIEITIARDNITFGWR